MDKKNETQFRRRPRQSAWQSITLLWVSFSLNWVDQVNGAGIQSGPSAANSYAGGMFYNVKENMVYVTGQTYADEFSESKTATTGSNCFVAVVNMDRWDWDDSAVLVGESDVATSACEAIGYMAPSYLVVGGISEKGGPAYRGSEVMVGFAALLDFTEYIVSVDSTVLTSTTSGRVEYPQFLVTQSENIFAISLTSVDSTPADTTLYANYMTHFKYGTSFYMTIRKWSLTRAEFLGVPAGPASLNSEWVHEFPVDATDGSTPAQVNVGGMIVKNDQFLIVAGSTRGQGVGYGPSNGGADEDGFITLLDLNSGELYQNLDPSTTTSESVAITKNNTRIGTDADDAVLGVCDDPSDPTSFYIVGATAGKMDPNDVALPPAETSLSGFVSKISLESLTTVWSRQWGARVDVSDAGSVTTAYAVHCAVNGSTIFVAGSVNNGAGIIVDQQILANQGGNDIWVASLQSDTGSANWVKQVGTSRNDELARHGAIAIDKDGDVILYGSTTGSFFRQSEDDAVDTSDVFVMIMNAENGDPGSLGHPVAAPTDLPTTSTTPPLPVATPTDPTTPPVPLATSSPQEFVPATSVPEELYPVTTERPFVKTIFFGIIGLLLILVLFVYFCISRRRAQKRAEVQRISIFSYLQEFDVEDVAVRKSPPGGWHGSYLNKLAYGINKTKIGNKSQMYESYVPDRYEIAPLANSSTVRDSLFVDTSSTPLFGFGDDSEHFGLDDLDGLRPRPFEPRISTSFKDIL